MKKSAVKGTIGFVVFVLIVLAVFYALSGKKIVQVPRDAFHNGVTKETPVSACMECHGPGKEHARKPAHPPKDDCLKCHKIKRVKPSAK